MITYRVDVCPILEEIGGSVCVDGSTELTELVVGDETFVPTEPVSFSATIANAGSGLVATGEVSAAVTATCVRCLCEFATTIEGEIEGFYVRSHEERGDEDDTEEVDENGSIDLGRALLAALVVEAPFAPLHDEECEGLCAHCGADLNTEHCECDEQVADEHPFAALKDVLIAEADGRPDEPKVLSEDA